MEAAVMKCKLIEVNVLEAFGKTIEIPTGRESEPFEFSDFLDLYLSRPNLCNPNYREELVKKLQDPKCFNLRYINDFLCQENSWEGNPEYSNWRIIEVWSPSLEQFVVDITAPHRPCHEYLEQDVVREMQARQKRETKERNRAKQEAEKPKFGTEEYSKKYGDFG